MKKAFLILRLLIEAALGLLNVSGFLLLAPYVYSSYFPQVLVIGFLGMPRRQILPPGPEGTEWLRFNAIATGVGWLIVALLFLNGLLWFKDVRDILRKLRAERQA